MFVAFRLKEGRDDELIQWLQSLGERDRSYNIREAMKAYLNGGTTCASISPIIKPIPPTGAKEVYVMDEDSLNEKLNRFIDD